MMHGHGTGDEQCIACNPSAIPFWQLTRNAVKPAALQTLHQAARPGLQQITHHDVRLLHNFSMLSKDGLVRLMSPCSCITTRQ